MSISTNSIIHYTASFSTLKSILKEGFRLKYCLEKLYIGTTSSVAAHPMISFCDIPLSDSTQHFAAYGFYGMGLSKKWAVQNGVNPVIYIDKDSLFAACIADLIIERRNDSTNLTEKQKDDILRIKSYAKNYAGPLKRRSTNSKDYRFYDEREWRLIPDDNILNENSFSISGKYYEAEKDVWNKRLSSIRIKFTTKDISYIIVKKIDEIPKMTNFLHSTYSGLVTADELNILLSKICSTEKIIADY